MGRQGLIVADTHVLVWLDFQEEPLGAEARAVAEDAWSAGELAVSAITFWEVAMLLRKQRLTLEAGAAGWRRELLGLGLREFPLDGEIGAAAETLADFHGDPADRMIVATALHRGAILLTADRSILSWPGPLGRIDARR